MENQKNPYDTPKYKKQQLIEIAQRYRNRGELIKHEMYIYAAIMRRPDAEEILIETPRSIRTRTDRKRKMQNDEDGEEYLLGQLFDFKEPVKRVDFVKWIKLKKKMSGRVAREIIDELEEYGVINSWRDKESGFQMLKSKDVERKQLEQKEEEQEWNRMMDGKRGRL